MNMVYYKYNLYSEPIGVSWEFDKKPVKIEFDFPISAAYSDCLKKVFVEALSEGSIYVFDEAGLQVEKKEIPKLEGYRFVGISQNKKSASGIAFLFHPEQDGLGNEWRDTELYEFLAEGGSIIG